MGCSSLTSIVVPEGAEYLESMAFYQMYGLKSLTIPKSVTHIGDYVWIDSPALTDVYYAGTEEEWNALTENVPLTEGTAGYTVHFNYTTDNQ